MVYTIISYTLFVIIAVLYVFELMIFARCILSFFPIYNGFTQWVYKATEPVLTPCRKLLDRFIRINLPVDFSPILAILILQLVQRLLRTLIINISLFRII